MCIRMWPSRSVHACRLYVHVGVALFTCSALVSTCQRRLTQGVDQFIFAGSVALTRCIKPDPYQTAHSSTSAIDRRLQKVQPCGRSTRGVGGGGCRSTESHHNYLHLFEVLQLPPIRQPAFPSLPRYIMFEWRVHLKGELCIQIHT